jgi:hypothetical protein
LVGSIYRPAGPRCVSNILERGSEHLPRRRAINAVNRAAFAAADGIGLLPNAPDGEPINWLTAITVSDPTRIREHLESLDIEARPAWKPMHLQPVFAGCEMRGAAVAEEIFRRRALERYERTRNACTRSSIRALCASDGVTLGGR